MCLNQQAACDSDSNNAAFQQINQVLQKYPAYRFIMTGIFSNSFNMIQPSSRVSH